MKRRDLLALVGGAAAWPIAARSQPAERIRRIGVLMAYAEGDSEGQAYIGAFRDGLQMLGWSEGRNLRIDQRWPGVDLSALEKSAKELVSLQPESILAANTPTTAALLRETRSIPVVFAAAADPVGSGFVASYPHPGGNVTGFTVLDGSMAGKWLELLKEIVPRLNRAAFLFNPGTAPFEYFLGPFKAAAASLNVQAIEAAVRDRSELDGVMAALAREPGGGLVVMPGPFATANRGEITALAALHRLPAAYPYRYFSSLGGLLSYGNDVSDNFRRAASYVDRILKGAKPDQLPVQAPVKFDLVINLKTARALSLDVPMLLQQRADEVIE